MSLFIKIIDVHAREILDSRGNPTVEVDVLRRSSFGMEKNGILGWVSGK